ncbi:MAG: hypothetical protein ACLFVU_04595 [Phycisphaerae bacterium]
MNKRILLTATAAMLALATLTGCGWLGLGDQEVTTEGPGGQTMTTAVPKNVTVHRGRTEILDVEVTRKKFSEPVEVSISQLPEGVTVDNQTQSVTADTGTFVLEAATDAPLVKNQAVLITAEGPEGMATRQYVQMSVEY